MVWWFLPLIAGGLALCLYVTLVLGFDADLWFDAFAPVFVPVAIAGLAILLPVVSFRVLQVFGFVGVVYVREFGDGSALLGSWWRVRGGQGLIVDRAAKVRVKAVETMPKTLGWRSDTGIPVYMAWTVATNGRKFSWLTPFEVAPDAAQRIHADLSGLPEPTFDSLEMSQAAQAA